MLLLFTLAAAAATPTPTPTPKSQGSISYFDDLDLPDWLADGDRGLWIRGHGRQWYYAEFAGPCHDLPLAFQIGFRTGLMGQLDKFGGIYVDDRYCPFASLVKSDAPPPKPKRKG